jgi:hypothetical protein
VPYARPTSMFWVRFDDLHFCRPVRLELTASFVCVAEDDNGQYPSARTDAALWPFTRLQLRQSHLLVTGVEII